MNSPNPDPPDNSPKPQTLRVTGQRGPLEGTVAVSGDKSISHRAALFGALATGPTRIANFLDANDCRATLAVVRGLGVAVAQQDDVVIVHGTGHLQEPAAVLDCGGSGTTLRLLAGILAGQPFYSVATGNAQLLGRPMGRIATPLRQMGATVLGRQDGRLAPLTILGGNLQAITYTTPVPSAQIKSAVLLAGLFAPGATVVQEAVPSRDHTERMLAAMGAPVERRNPTEVAIRPGPLTALTLTVPGDISSAAFVLVAAAASPGAAVRVAGVNLNPTRTGVLDVITAMGGVVRLEQVREEHGEPVGDIVIEARSLHGTRIAGALIPRLIDELPVLAVLATQADGVTEVRDAAELRVKETDRIAAIVEELGRLGATIEALPDGFRIHGPTRLLSSTVHSHGDHRLAMALAVAGLLAEGETTVEDTACIADSFPTFVATLRALGATVEG